jgi:hypothetical protein
MNRTLVLKPNNKVTPCPKCGNNTHFTLHAVQFAEDCCETFVVCKCGHEPTGESGDRYENVWGEMDNGAAMIALDCWNAALAT